MNLLSVDLNDLYLFTQVVERRSFTAAGDALDMPKSSISRRISQLEATLDTRLLQRTSRSLSLTDAGQELYVHCAAMVAEAMAGEAAVRQRQAEPAGTVRASLPVAIADLVLARLLPGFMLKYPKIRLIIQAANRRVDLIEENIDVVVRGVNAEMESSSLVKANLCTTRWVLAASPIYLAQNGRIDTLEALAQADALLYAPMNGTEIAWELCDGDNARRDIPIKKLRLQSDNLSILKETVMAGMGVAALPFYLCIDALEARTLNLVLPAWRPKAGHLVVLFPSRRGLAPAVRTFVDFLKTELPPLLSAEPRLR
ncbi:transcriptional regulator [Herbaspirillum sp. CF444]|uniref:LysR substrate-binding domain-containing protein n=1 Tax=Herbaspirillum sp. CF444 TaxID=1144319 RepID=UPI0002724C6F|nr:LysR substrate-binding domain-containing protein [Herbaspirillum sp. CF444]EJL81030.1 transcriptional regulator [Herbaspirillum sp. CF444]